MDTPVIDHGPYTREVESATTAVLMIHGIAGTPAHFRELIPVIPETMSVYNILLDGHGGSVKDFARTSMKKWKDQALGAVTELSQRYEKLYIVAHSMGTLFAIRAAIEQPEKIRGLFLLAVPSRPWVRFSTWCTSVQLALGKENERTRILGDACSIRLQRNLLSYIGWIPRFWELLMEVRKVRKLLPQLNTPTMSFQSKVDELVSARSIGDLEVHPVIQNTVLYDSGHFAYGEQDILLLQKRLKAMLR